MVSAAKQLEALTLVIRRVTEVGERHGIAMVHQTQNSGRGDGGGADASGGGANGELPAPLEAVAHPEAAAAAAAAGGSAWKPRNTLVRGVLREVAQSAAREQLQERPESSRRGGKYM